MFIKYGMKLIEDGFFKRNKKIILISFVIFIIFFLAGMIISNILIGDNAGIITQKMSELPKNTTQNVDVSFSSVDIFIHNITVNIIIIVGGILFSVISVLVTVFNAISIGSPFGTDLTFALVAVLPHSIFEYAATALSLAVAFMLTKLEIAMIRNRSFRGTLAESETELKDILVLIIVVIVLLIIAAIIEGHITPIITKSFFGL